MMNAELEKYIEHLRSRAIDHSIEKHLAREIHNNPDSEFDHAEAERILDKAIAAETREANNDQQH